MRKTDFEKRTQNKFINWPKICLSTYIVRLREEIKLSVAKTILLFFTKDEEMCETRSEKFRSVFVQETKFETERDFTNNYQCNENVTLQKDEIKELLKGLDETMRKDQRRSLVS